MESTLKCEIGSCANTALHYQKDFKVYICEEHSKMTQSQNCEKLEDSEGIEETLKVLEECIKNFSVSAESEDKKEDLANNKEFIDSFKEKLTQISTNFNCERENQNFHQYSSIRKEVASVAKELKENPFFQKFCIHSYISLMCDYLSFDKAKVENITDSVYEQEEDPIEPQELLPVHPQPEYQQQSTLEDELQTLKLRFDQFKTKALTMINLRSHNDLEESYELITGQKLQIEADKRISFDCSSEENTKFMESISDRVLPDYPCLRIDRINADFRLMKQFVISSFPQRVERLDFNTNGIMSNADDILDIYSHISSRVTQQIYLYNFEVSEHSMKILLNTSRLNQNILGFIYCKIDLDTVPNFKHSLNSSKIKTLNFAYCGEPEYCDWKNYPERFSNLIQGLSQSERCRYTLKDIHLKKCGLSKDSVRKVLDTNGFNKTNILNHSINSIISINPSFSSKSSISPSKIPLPSTNFQLSLLKIQNLNKPKPGQAKRATHNLHNLACPIS
ncbi:unnamed protein product [Moneuplotes crassus]|uniref:Uncharacterized protein n=1 Tax=Euplotes crassus TaxID=5936 RepID=A0AAD1U944_EUPCR|nr:unnamed protein product [Moneuplotes crassus]